MSNPIEETVLPNLTNAIKDLIHTEIVAFAQLLRDGLKEKQKSNDHFYDTDAQTVANETFNEILDTLENVIVDEAERLKNGPAPFTPAPTVCPKCGNTELCTRSTVYCIRGCFWSLGRFYTGRNGAGFVPYKDEEEERLYNATYYRELAKKAKGK